MRYANKNTATTATMTRTKLLAAGLVRKYKLAPMP